METEAVFAGENDESVRGIITLEGLGFRVNPLIEKLGYIGLVAV